ncbi:hypothetical protein [Streptomyces sp. AD55]|uniref:hypothetical protein n=1 Tax=Streptomyces sp. AD55 TaxID=3242895 RepID=UPI003528235E
MDRSTITRAVGEVRPLLDERAAPTFAESGLDWVGRTAGRAPGSAGGFLVLGRRYTVERGVEARRSSLSQVIHWKIARST